MTSSNGRMEKLFNNFTHEVAVGSVVVIGKIVVDVQNRLNLVTSFLSRTEFLRVGKVIRI